MISNPIYIFFFLTLCAYLGICADKNKLLSKFSGVAVTMVLAMLLSTFELIPSESEIYDLTWAYFVPLAIPLLLLRANFRQIKKSSPGMLSAFLLGMIGTIIGSFIAFSTFSIGAENYKVVSMLSGSYTGGSVNLIAISNALNLESKSLFSCIIATDNLLMVVYFSILSILGASSFFKKFLPIHEKNVQETENDHILNSPLVIEATFIAFIMSAGFYLIGTYLETLIAIPGMMIMAITILSILLANLFPTFCEKLLGSELIAKFFMMIFFAAIGASSDIKNVLSAAPHLFCIISTILICQLSMTIIGAKLFKISYDKVIIACNANAGGPATAAAFAGSYGWKKLIAPAILCGTLGYAIGTFIGISIAQIFLSF